MSTITPVAPLTSPLAPPASPLLAPHEEPLFEVVNGQRVELPPMSAYAGLIASRLDQRLGPFVETHGLGIVVAETLFLLDPVRDLRRRPDVAFVSTDRWPVDRELPLTGDWGIVPDLAVEVISPNEVFEDALAKMREYFQVGVREVWLVLPIGRHVHVYSSPSRGRILTPEDELDGGTLLPGFRLPLANLFPRQSQASNAPTGM